MSQQLTFPYFKMMIAKKYSVFWLSIKPQIVNCRLCGEYTRSIEGINNGLILRKYIKVFIINVSSLIFESLGDILVENHTSRL